MKIYGIVGREGAGKDTLSKYLSGRYGIPRLSVGEMVRETAIEEGLAPTRQALRRLSHQRTGLYGERYFIVRAIEQIRRNGWEEAIVAGMSTAEEVRALKEEAGESFILMHICVTSPRRRFQRLRLRGGPCTPGSYAEFLEGEREAEQAGLEKAVDLADYSLSNEKSIEDLCKRADRILLKVEDKAGMEVKV